MANLGIDMGAENTKVAIMDNGNVLALAGVHTGFDQQKSADEAIALALTKAKLSRDKIERIGATGIGRKAISDIATNEVNEIISAAKGISFYYDNKARTVIDAGAEEARAIRLDADGNVREFVVNEKCAAGAGTFTEAMAEALEVSLEKFCEAALHSSKKTPMNAQCTIFAESEVVSLIASGVSLADIARAVQDAIADRISAIMRRVGLEDEIVLIGGMGKNGGFVDALKRSLERDVLVPQDPDYVSAIGAAIPD